MELTVLSENIKRLRKGRISQKRLAQEEGITLAEVNALEEGRDAPRPGTLQAIAAAIDVHPCDLFAPVREWKSLRWCSHGVIYEETFKMTPSKP